MKNLTSKILFLFFLQAGPFSYGQVNLVPNPSFEDTIFCPWAENQMPSQWLCFGNSPDYYHACSSTLNVPNTPTGFHNSHSGVAMTGVFTYVGPTSPDWPYYREYIGVQLIDPITIGQKYYMSFFLNFGSYLPGWRQLGADKLGMKFSSVAFSEFNPPPLNNFAHLYVDSIYTDTLEWVKVSGSFIADSAYNYLIIGNFFDEIQTDTLSLWGPHFGGEGAYYFLDDVCISTDSIYNATWTGLNEQNIDQNFILVFPNPVSDILTVSGASNMSEIQIINSLGQIVYKKQLNGENNLQFSTSEIPSGIYFMNIRLKNNYYVKRVNIIH
jgi:hypothetical protein